MNTLESWLPSHDALTGSFVLLVGAAGAVVALVFVLAVMALRDDGLQRTVEVSWRGALVIAVGALIWAWFNSSVMREQAAEKAALETRAANLATLSLAPGSVLACLNSVGNEAVESACLKAVFASPQSVAAA